MKVAVWKTGHQIADTVADALAEGLNADVFQASDVNSVEIAAYQVHIGYGILRGSSEVFSRCEKLGMSWFNVDRGFTNPYHYSGNYRISHKGTQAIWHDDALSKPVDIKLEPFRPFDKSKRTLVCPPTDGVCKFYNLSRTSWLNSFLFKDASPNQCFTYSEVKQLLMECDNKFIIRDKGDPNPIPWDNISMVITFNSSVGWEAIRRGIPCLSDVNHSTVGSFYGETVTEKLLEKFYSLDRMRLFQFMAAHQFTLEEIRQGHAWPLLQHYLSGFGSATTPEKPSAPMLRPTRFAAGPAQSPLSVS